MNSAIGLDFGTNSVRTLLLKCSDGSEPAGSVFDYIKGILPKVKDVLQQAGDGRGKKYRGDRYGQGNGAIMSVGLEDYFESLALAGRECDFQFVKDLQSRHLAQFCFNSVAVQLEREISLEMEDLLKKIVVDGRGGYCFEHNKLIYEALLSKGYSVRFVIGKVLNNQEVDTPRTHRTTLLEWEGDSYIVDAGFGSRSPRFPVKISEGFVSKETGRSFQVQKRSDGDFQLVTFSPKGPFVLYKFDLNTYTEADCKMGNHYSACHPDAVFVNHLVCSKILSDRILYLLNRTFQVIYPDRTETTPVTGPGKLREILSGVFQLELSEKECVILFAKTEKYV